MRIKGVIKKAQKEADRLYERVYINDFELFEGDILEYESSVLNQNGQMITVEVVKVEGKNLLFKWINNSKEYLLCPTTGKNACLIKQAKV